MEHEIRRRRLHLSEVPVRLDGLDPQTAREVADLLPGAIRAAVAGGGVMPQRSTAQRIAAGVATEIAGRIQAAQRREGL